MTTHYAILKDGDVSIKILISQQQLILNLVSNEFKDITVVFADRMCKLSNLSVHEF